MNDAKQTKDLIATASIVIDAPQQKVWEALVDPAAIKHYMFGSTVKSDWKVGSPITWSGQWQGTDYQDKGEILKIEPGKVLEYSHFSPLSKLPDKPENYHVVTIELAADGQKTGVTLKQNNNPTAQARDHSQGNWQGMLKKLKEYVEAEGAKSAG